MNRSLILTAVALLAGASLAVAQSGSTGAQAAGAASGAAGATGKSMSANAAATADVHADADADFKRLKQDVQSKGDKVSAAARAKAEVKITAAAKRVDDEAAKGGSQGESQGENQGERQVASRLAAEFKTTADAMIAERKDLDASWGELMIAHSLSVNAKAGVTVEQLVRMHGDGMGWGLIAAGLGLKLGDVVSAANAESQVALGQAKADGKAAVIHGEGARAGVGAGAGVDAGLGSGHARAGAGVGVGVRIKPGR